MADRPPGWGCEPPPSCSCESRSPERRPELGSCFRRNARGVGMRLNGKVAIVTGAASGIGKATAALFRAEGAQVIAADMAEAEGVARADAGSEADISGLVDQAVRAHGGLDIFFANAG